MPKRRHTLARLGAGLAAALAAGALVGIASPAFAEEGTPSPAPSESSAQPPSDPSTAPTSPSPSKDTKSAAPFQENEADLRIEHTSEGFSVGTAGKDMWFNLENLGPADAKGVRVMVDVSGLADSVDVTWEPECEVDGKKAVCLITGPGQSLPQFRIYAFHVVLKAAAGASTGPAGSISMAITSDLPDPEPGNNKDTVPVSISDRNTDLAVLAFDVTADPGATVGLDFMVFNYGETAPGVRLHIRLPEFVTFAVRNPDFCTYPDAQHAVCELFFDGGGLHDGEFFNSDPQDGFGVPVKVAGAAPGSAKLQGTIAAEGIHELSIASRRSHVNTQKVAAAPADADPKDNSATFSVKTTAGKADFAIAASKANGEVGEEVTVTVTVTNHGPTTIQGFDATVKAPTGTEIVDAPEECTVVTAGKEYFCHVGGPFAAGEGSDGDFIFKINQANPGSDGTATVKTAVPDPKLANNTAKIVITTGGGGGGLPTTGRSLGIAGGVGLALLTLGGVLFVLGRRRAALAMAGATEETETEA